MEHLEAADVLARWRREGPCWDCGAILRSPHGDTCDVARCLYTGLQRIGCSGIGHRCGNAVHDGYWPGERECAVLGWVLYAGDEVLPDLNRLLADGVWNRERGWWEPRAGAERETPDAAMEWFIPGSLVVKTTEHSDRLTIASFGGRIEVEKAALGELCWNLSVAAARPVPAFLHSLGKTVEIAFEQITPLAEVLWSIHVDPTRRPAPRAPVPRPVADRHLRAV